MIKQLVKSTRLGRRYLSLRRQRQVKRWKALGRPVPPPHAVKVETVRRWASKYGIRTLVETGTWMGDMIYAVQDDFDRIISVELNPELAARARELFASQSHIEIMQGDSAKLMPEILSAIDGPAVFWLDAHCTAAGDVVVGGDSVITEEVVPIILHNHRHLVLIDDARLFVGRDGYPQLKPFLEYLGTLRPNALPLVANDIIQVHPTTR